VAVGPRWQPARDRGQGASLIAGVAVVVRPLAGTAQSPAIDTREIASGSAWRGTAATAARRIDGRPKVTGAKLYAADFRAQDMPGWPRHTAHAGDRPFDARHRTDARSCRVRERPCWCWDHRAEFLCRRSPLSLGQDPTLSRSARCAFDLERLSPFRAVSSIAEYFASARKPAWSPSNLTRARASCALPAPPRGMSSNG
jgi:hypothetical protein